MGRNIPFPTLTIPNGQDTSNEILELSNLESLTIIAPAGLVETVNIEVSAERTPSVWATLQSNNEDVVLAAGKATVLTHMPGMAIRLKSTTNVAANRAFLMSASTMR